MATTARSVPLARPAAANVPSDGWYVNGNSTEDTLRVEQGAVLEFNFPSVTKVCSGLGGFAF